MGSGAGEQKGRPSAGGDSRSRLRFLKSILDNANDAVLVTEGSPVRDPGPRVIYVNEAFCRMSGYSAREVLGGTPRLLQGPETSRAPLDRVRKSLEEKRPVKAEVLNYRKDGSTFWVEMDIVPVPGEGDWPEYWVSVQRETTARRRAEDGLRDTETRLKTLLACHGSEMVTIFEPEGALRYESPAVEKVLGYPPGRSAEGFSRLVHPEDVERFREAVARCFAVPGSSESVEFRVRHADGSWRWLEAVGRNLSHDPDVKGVVVRSRDVNTRKEADEALRASEERFRSLVSNSSEVVKITDPDGTLRYASPSMQCVLGYKPEEILGKNVLDFVHPDDLPRVLEETRKAMEKTGSANANGVANGVASGVANGVADGVARNVAEYRFRHKDGSWRYVEASGAYLQDDPAVGGVLVNARDVSERKEAEKKLREAEERYRTLVERVPGIIYIEDAETAETLYDSPQIEEILGYPKDTFKKDPDYWWKIVHPEDHDRVLAELGATQESKTEYRVFARDGRLVWLRDEAAVLNDAAGKPKLRHGFLFDITDRKEAEERLRKAEERYRTLTEQVPAVTYMRELKSAKVTYVSPRIENLLGYRPADFYADGGFWYGIVHPEDRRKVVAEDRRTDETGEPFSLDYRVVRPGGEVLWVRDEAVLLQNEGGSARFWHGVVYDITERKRFEEALRESEERFRSLVQNASDLIAILDADFRAFYLSPSFEKVQGYEPSERLGGDALENIHPDDVEQVRAALGGLLAEPSGEPTLDFRLRRRDGDWIHLSAVGRNLLADPAVGGIVVNARDVTERKRAEQALKESEARLASVTSGAPVILFALDRDGVLTLAEGKGLDSLDLAPEELIGKSIFEVYKNLPHVLENLRRALSGEPVVATVKIGELTFDARYSPVFTEGGEVSGVIGVATDITERRKLEKELEHRAFHDPLTGLANRALCIDRLGHALGRAERSGSPVALIFMDLDDFKVVNDSLGHTTGDELLVEVSGRLRGCLRPGDTLARLGGDEFVVLLEDTDLDGALRVAGRIAAVLGPPFFLGGQRHERFVTASVGITLATGAGRGAEDLLREADLAMYRAKEEGKARHEVFDSTMSAKIRRRVELEGNLRRAFKLGQFEVRYQPQVSLKTGEVVFLEALLRWRRPERGLVGPQEFIGLLEETGLIVPLGRKVLEESCRRLADWRGANGSPGLCVNLSARQFRHPDLARDVSGILQRSGLPPEALFLEITESVAMAGSPETDALGELKNLGAGLMIDDFGTGHSSLSYLKSLPVDFLKIDRSFIRGLGEDPVDEEIVAAIVRLAHAVGLKVVAEGVENAAQALRLKKLGCEYAQGYFFSEPLPAEEVPNLLRAGSLRKRTRPAEG